jgi:hypothetical protein
MKRIFLKIAVLTVAIMLPFLGCKDRQAEDSASPEIIALLDKQNVEWDTPGPTSRESMPLGNGDIALNVWVEENGDVLFYIGKTDSWDENVGSVTGGLLKLGEVRVKLTPNALPAGAPFRQILKLHEGEILVKEGDDTEIRVWVDANHPVVHVETKSRLPSVVQASLRNWRTDASGLVSPDILLPQQPDRVVWYHRNSEKGDPQTAGLTSGALMRGNRLVTADSVTLVTETPVTSQLISIYPLTLKTNGAEEWLAALEGQAQQIERIPPEQVRRGHRAWWSRFWERSWIFVEGDGDAETVTRGYVLQRFVTACCGRGAYPIKFNGSLFTVDYPEIQDFNDQTKTIAVTADYRYWGGMYWFQNTRAMYWPRLMAGDFDMMLPLFRMYRNQLDNNSRQIREYYQHGGAYFAETAPFWGGLPYAGKDLPGNYTTHYFLPVIELSMMMLDYYEYTGDSVFARDFLLPVADAGLQFYNEHFGRDADGRLLLDSCNAIEMFWKVTGPAPDIAGLYAVLPRMLALPEQLASPQQRNTWNDLLNSLPEIPVGVKNGKEVLLPYTGEQTAPKHNSENPELYAVYPFRLYGMGKPDLDLAIRTFQERNFRGKGCWMQDPIQAARLGLTEIARKYTLFALSNKDPALKFPAFWYRTNDYAPDQDNGGNGENGLQQMLMQTDGDRIYLLPAWPKEWNARFKLHAPHQTTVEATVEAGRIITLKVTPEERGKEVVILSGQ